MTEVTGQVGASKRCFRWWTTRWGAGEEDDAVALTGPDEPNVSSVVEAAVAMVTTIATTMKTTSTLTTKEKTTTNVKTTDE
jgi:hypothetical protein